MKEIDQYLKKIYSQLENIFPQNIINVSQSVEIFKFCNN